MSTAMVFQSASDPLSLRGGGLGALGGWGWGGREGMHSAERNSSSHKAVVIRISILHTAIGLGKK